MNPQGQTSQTMHQPQASEETQAAQEVEQSSAASEALAKLSHELKAPLASIKESARLLREEAVGPLTMKQRSVIKSIEADAERLLRLVRNVLVLSKSQLGQLELLRQPVSLEAIINEAVGRLKPQLEHRTINVDAKNLPPVFADRDRLFQVIVNLLGNAIKATADDGRIAASAILREKCVELSVTDNGCGIPAERLVRLFEPFRSGNVSTVEPGSGLGLAICKELIERHGGTIEISSVVGKGTTAKFSIPLFTPEMAVEMFLQEILEEGAPSDSVMTVCLLRLSGIGQIPDAPPAIHELVEGILRNHLRSVDRLCWVDSETVLIVVAADLEGAKHLMGRLRKLRAELTQAAEGRPVELFWGLACAGHPRQQTAQELLQEARASLQRMIANW